MERAPGFSGAPEVETLLKNGQCLPGPPEPIDIVCSTIGSAGEKTS
jgi:hypothetical protein